MEVQKETTLKLVLNFQPDAYVYNSHWKSNTTCWNNEVSSFSMALDQ